MPLFSPVASFPLGKPGNCFTKSQHSSDEIIEAIIALSPDKQENIMTALQQLEQKGRQEGMQQGMQTKALAIAKNMLHYNESKEKIHQFTGLSWVEIEQLLQEERKGK